MFNNMTRRTSKMMFTIVITVGNTLSKECIDRGILNIYIYDFCTEGWIT